MQSAIYGCVWGVAHMQAAGVRGSCPLLCIFSLRAYFTPFSLIWQEDFKKKNSVTPENVHCFLSDLLKKDAAGIVYTRYTHCSFLFHIYKLYHLARYGSADRISTISRHVITRSGSKRPSRSGKIPLSAITCTMFAFSQASRSLTGTGVSAAL